MSNNFAFSLNEIDNNSENDSNGCISVVNLTNLQRISNPLTIFYNSTNQKTNFAMADSLDGNENKSNIKLLIKSTQENTIPLKAKDEVFSSFFPIACPSKPAIAAFKPNPKAAIKK